MSDYFKNGADDDDDMNLSIEVKIEPQPQSISSVSPAFDRDHIGRYEIIYPIAQGGMAGVYAGRLTGIAGFQRLVAIKIIHPHLAQDDSFIRMFLDEARLSAGIHHPNVGEVIDVGEDEGLYYMVCELILGQSLRALHRRALHKNVSIPPALYARIVSLTASALQAAHDLAHPDGTPLNLVHRDVSPRNILITYEGVVKLIDFGVAYARDRLAETDVGTVKGKIGYMSPEQLKSRGVDRRSDIFSLGVVLYEMVTGRSPFHGKTEIERIDKILKHQIEKPTSVNPDIPEQLESIILRAVASNPNHRYADGAAMSADLEGFINASDVSAGPDALSQVMQSIFNEERARHLGKIKKLGTGGSFPVPAPEVEKTLSLRAKSKGAPDHLPRTSSSSTKKQQKRTARLMAAISFSVAVGAMLSLSLFWVSRTRSGPAPNPSGDAQDGKLTAALNNRPDRLIPDSAESSLAPTEVSITLDIVPSEVGLVLNDTPLKSDTKRLRLPADGQIYRLRVSADGYIAHEERIRADNDKTVSVVLTAETTPPQSAKQKKKMRESSDGRSLGTTKRKVDFPSPVAAPTTSSPPDEPPAPLPDEPPAPLDELSKILEDSPYR